MAVPSPLPGSPIPYLMSTCAHCPGHERRKALLSTGAQRTSHRWNMSVLSRPERPRTPSPEGRAQAGPAPRVPCGPAQESRVRLRAQPGAGSHERVGGGLRRSGLILGWF